MSESLRRYLQWCLGWTIRPCAAEVVYAGFDAPELFPQVWVIEWPE